MCTWKFRASLFAPGGVDDGPEGKSFFCELVRDVFYNLQALAPVEFMRQLSDDTGLCSPPSSR